MKAYCKNLFSDIEKRQQNFEFDYSNEDSIIEFSYEMTNYLKDQLEVLRSKIKTKGFSDIKEEVIFFKELKPKIHSLLLFYIHVYNLETSRPIGLSKKVKSHYKSFIAKVSEENSKFYNLNSFYKYVKSNRIDKDECFFTRAGNTEHVYMNTSTFFLVDKQFTTIYDNILSMIIAEEKLNDYISKKLLKYDHTTVLTIENLDWSASKSSMIELIYALYISKSINDSSINKIATIFEQLFEIKLGNVHHSFHRMKYRSDSRTLFLDKLKQSLEMHLEMNEAL